MAGSHNGEEDDSIKPVSSLRSKFEHLSTPTAPTPPPPAKKPSTLAVPAEPAERQRSSLDIPRPSAWELAQGNGQKADPPAPSAGPPPMLAPRMPLQSRQRPVSMGPWSPPRSPPLSGASNPFSPASALTDSTTASPRTNLFSPDAAAAPRSPMRGKPTLPPPPLQKEKKAAAAGADGRKMPPPSPSGFKKPPPPINRSNKPGAQGMTVATGLVPALDPRAEEATSPFNTPPSSNESPHMFPGAASDKARGGYFAPPPTHHAAEARRGSAVPAPRLAPLPKTRMGSVPNVTVGHSDQPSDRPQLPARREPEPVAPVTVHVTAPSRQGTEARRKISAHPAPRPPEARKEGAAKDEFLPPPRRVVTGPTKDDSHSHARIGSTAKIQPPHPHRIASDPITTTTSSRASSTQGNYSDVEAHLTDDQSSTGITSYPDSSLANRRPPKAKGCSSIYPDYDTRLFDICSRYCCTIGYLIKVYDTTSGRTVYEQSFQERDMKATAVVFKPGAGTDEEGRTIWVGNNIGEIQEIDIVAQRLVHSKPSAHSRREIIKMYRFQNSIWSVDEDGKFHVWPPDDTGIPSLQKQPLIYRVARGHTCSIVVKRDLWYACGKDIRIYNPMGGENNFHVTTYALSQPSAGDITSAAVVSSQLERVYFSHSDGKVSVYTTDFQCLGVVGVSSYKINTLTGAGNYLWAGFNTGKICVYDTHTNPWTIKKEWLAHTGPVSSIMADRSSVWKSGTLPVASIGVDKTISVWDGWLETDWLETDMQEHDAEFCDYRELRAMVCTWNAGASTPGTLRAEDKDSNFFREIIRANDPPDLLVFGFQELVDLEDKKLTAKTLFKGTKKKDSADHEHMSRQYRAWRDYLARVIEDYMPSNEPYTLLQTANLVGLFSCIFVKSSERPKISDVQVAQVKRGLGGLHGNKGAIIMRFILDHSSLCFTNCHLAAGQNHTAHRNDDITAILEATGLPKEPDLERRLEKFVGGGDGTQVMDHEICVINGDMNYRIDTMGRDTVIKAVNAGNLGRLLERDQLLVSKRRNPAFRLRSFHEQPISFAPTYKYDVGSDRYDTSDKGRSPAWCDRILYRGAGRIRQLQYRRHEGIRVSDHRPVSGTFAMRIKQIRAKQRARVWEQCEQRLVVEKLRYARDAKLDYLINVLGVEPKEAARLIAR